MISKAIRHEQDYLNIPLHGQVFIESSAGTGKTYTLERIYLRLLEEKGMDIEDILVVTFNESASKQLKEKIQERLTQNPETVNYLTTFSQAKIFTMHAFVRQILKEFSSTFKIKDNFSLGSQEEIYPLQIKAIYQFFRSKEKELKKNKLLLYGYEAFLALIAGEGKNDSFSKAVEKLASLFNRDLISKLSDFLQKPAQKELKRLWDSQEVEALSISLRNWQEGIVRLKETFKEEKQPFNKVTLRSLYPLLELVANSDFSPPYLWSSLAQLSKTICAKKGFEKDETYIERLLSFSSNLSLHLNKNCQLPCSVDSQDLCRKAEEVRILLPSLLLEASNSSIGNLNAWLAWNFVYFALEESQKELDKLKDKLNFYSFEDILYKLLDSQTYLPTQTLKDIQKSYRAILIDEFQDTDSLQWTIFSQIVKTKETFLFMIGDPKQAIYGFRGGDLSTFYRAKTEILRQEKSYFYHLPVNHRSQEQMVEMLNTVFRPLYCKDNLLLNHATYYNELETCEQNKRGNTEKNVALTIWRPNEEQTYSQQLLNFLCKISNFLCKENITAQECVILSREKATLWELLQINAQKKINLPLALYEEKSLKDSQQAEKTFALLHSLKEPHLHFSSLMLSDFFCLPLKVVSYLGQESQASLRDSLIAQLYTLWQILDKEGNFLIFMQAIESLSRKIRKQISQSDFPLSKLEKKELRELGFEERLLLKSEKANLLLYQEVFLWLSENIHHSSDINLFLKNLNQNQNCNCKRCTSLENKIPLMTIHKAKGLEFSYVFIIAKTSLTLIFQKNNLYFSYYEQENKIFDFFKLKKSESKSLLTAWEEEKNLLYVALTRAKKRVFFLWENQKKICNNLSTLFLHSFLSSSKNKEPLHAQLLSKPEEDIIIARLNDCNSCVNYEPLTNFLKVYSYKDYELRRLCAPPKSVSKQDILSRSLTTISFSSLLRTSNSLDTELVQSTIPNETFLPKGALIGNWIHSLLEILPFNSALDSPNAKEWIKREIYTKSFCGKIETLFKQKLNEYLPSLCPCEKYLECAINMIWNLLTSRLEPLEIRLCETLNDKTLKEHKFLLKVQEILTHKSFEHNHAQLLQHYFKKGYLTGVIDCILEIGDKIYIFDWKTNFLGNRAQDYAPQKLQLAMQENNYYLQESLYSIALKVWHSLYKPSISFKEIFGGSLYLFTRAFLEEPQNKKGIYFIAPCWEKLDNLESFFLTKPQEKK